MSFIEIIIKWRHSSVCYSNKKMCVERGVKWEHRLILFNGLINRIINMAVSNNRIKLGGNRVSIIW